MVDVSGSGPFDLLYKPVGESTVASAKPVTKQEAYRDERLGSMIKSGTLAHEDQLVLGPEGLFGTPDGFRGADPLTGGSHVTLIGRLSRNHMSEIVAHTIALEPSQELRTIALFFASQFDEVDGKKVGYDFLAALPGHRDDIFNLTREDIDTHKQNYIDKGKSALEHSAWAPASPSETGIQKVSLLGYYVGSDRDWEVIHVDIKVGVTTLEGTLGFLAENSEFQCWAVMAGRVTMLLNYPGLHKFVRLAYPTM
jgi:hypothetical protein